MSAFFYLTNWEMKHFIFLSIYYISVSIQFLDDKNSFLFFFFPLISNLFFFVTFHECIFSVLCPLLVIDHKKTICLSVNDFIFHLLILSFRITLNNIWSNLYFESQSYFSHRFDIRTKGK